MYQSSTSELEVILQGAVLELRLARPARKNALTLAMYQALADMLYQADRDPAVRAILITGSGADFTAGNDLADFMNNPQIRADHPSVQFIDAMRHARKPVVAKVRGNAIGIGATLLQHVDFAYASRDARIQMPFVGLGLAPENAASVHLPRLVGPHAAKRLLLLGEAISGAEAASMGLITAACDDAQLDGQVQATLERLVQQPPAALRRAKALLKEPLGAAEDAALAREYSALAQGLESAECREAIAAFFEKRQADFSQFS